MCYDHERAVYWNKTQFKDQTFKVWRDPLVANSKPPFCASNDNTHWTDGGRKP